MTMTYRRWMPDAVVDHPRVACVYDPLDPDRSELDTYVSLVDEFGVASVLDVGCDFVPFESPTVFLADGERSGDRSIWDRHHRRGPLARSGVHRTRRKSRTQRLRLRHRHTSPP